MQPPSSTMLSGLPGVSTQNGASVHSARAQLCDRLTSTQHYGSIGRSGPHLVHTLWPTKHWCSGTCVNVMCRYLAHMYMAECLVALDCIADGIDHLSPDLITDIGTVFPTEHKSEQGCMPADSSLSYDLHTCHNLINPFTASCQIYPLPAEYCSRHITEICGDMR